MNGQQSMLMSCSGVVPLNIVLVTLLRNRMGGS